MKQFILLLLFIAISSIIPCNSAKETGFLSFSSEKYSLGDLESIYDVLQLNKESQSELHINCISSHNPHHPDCPTCFSPTQIFRFLGYDEEKILTNSQFLELAPTLLSMTGMSQCKRDSIPHIYSRTLLKSDSPIISNSTEISKDVWVATYVSVTIVSLFALLGPALIPFLGRSWTSTLIDFLVSLGAGVLIADGFLHLIPQALGVHSHEEEEDHDHTNGLDDEAGILHEPDFSSLYISLTVLMTIYLLFLIEKTILPFFGLGHSHDETPDFHSHSRPHSHGPSHMHSHSHTHSHDHAHSSPPPPPPTYGAVRRGSDQSSTTDFAVRLTDSETEQLVTSPKKRVEITINKSVGWFIFAADIVHNFVDGIAIGASFAVSRETGISTTLAVVLHEVPHEISDFAILISAGFSIKKAIFLNIIDQVSAFAGAALGVYLGSSPTVVNYIIAATAGMFLYLGLIDLLPLLEVKHGESESKVKVLFRHFGILLGVLLLIIVSVYEEKSHEH